MPAYYNENEPFAVEWLRNLIKAGHIAPGVVDDRSIHEVQPSDLVGFDQCHFFAGIGGWSHALRIAGWPDDKPVWTASCPCPPFSSAGKQFMCPSCQTKSPVPCPRRTGYFICWYCEHAWLADARHLWPEFWRLVAHRKPSRIYGEQVASADGRVWLTGVRASLEIMGYAVECADLCAAGVGAPQIRQRLWWMAGTGGEQSHGRRGEGYAQRQFTNGSRAVGLGDATGQRRGETRSDSAGPAQRASRAGSSGMGDADRTRPQGRPGMPERSDQWATRAASVVFWDAFDVIPFATGESRRIEPGSFPLAHGVSGRVGKLRAYGNAIVPQDAAEFIAATE